MRRRMPEPDAGVHREVRVRAAQPPARSGIVVRELFDTLAGGKFILFIFPY